MLVFYFSVREILIGENLLEIIFFSTFNVLLLLIWARFVYGFASIFFFGKIYSFQGYELNLTSDKWLVIAYSIKNFKIKNFTLHIKL